MTKYKFLIILLLVLCLSQVSMAEKRVKAKPLKELTDPSSPSYVPFPYPKTDDEIIADLKYAFKKFNTPREGRYNSFVSNKILDIKKFEVDFLKENNEYKIGEIIKAEYRNTGCAHDYYWLVIVLYNDNSIAARIIMNADGLYSGKAFYPKGWKYQCYKNEQEVLGILGDYIGRPISKKDIKRIKRVAYPSKIGDDIIPFWEIKLLDGTLYYYSPSRNKVYKITEKIPWKKNKKGNRPDWRKLIPHMDVAFDMIDDEILVFEEVKKKK